MFNFDKAVMMGFHHSGMRTNKALAFLSGVPEKTLGQCRLGRTPSMDTVEKVAAAFNVQMSVFIGWGE